MYEQLEYSQTLKRKWDPLIKVTNNKAEFGRSWPNFIKSQQGEGKSTLFSDKLF